MNIQVVPRYKAEAVSKDIKEPHIWISINSSQSYWADLKGNPNCKGILRVKFDDVFITEPDFNLQAITPYQAELIWDFVDARFNQVESIYIHCDAGVSRSPAVAAAISRIYLNEDESYFTNSKSWCPNKTVYLTLLNFKGIKVDLQKLNSYYTQLFKEVEVAF